MQSKELFEAGAPRRRPDSTSGGKRATLAIVTSMLLPGTGHFLLGRFPLGAGLAGAALLCGPVAVALSLLLPDPWARVSWLFGRAAVLCAVFAVADVAWTAAERAAGRRPALTPPRLAALWNALGYGVTQIRLGETAGGAAAIALGGGAHLASVLFAPEWVRWCTEIIPLSLAVWGYRMADAIGAPRSISTELGELDRPSRSPNRSRAVGPAPWWITATTAVAVVWGAAAIVLWDRGVDWREAQRVDQRVAVELEPYYRNPAYDLQVEMRAPGWSFREAGRDAFVRAQHPAEASMLQLFLRPRRPWGDDEQSAAAREIERLIEEGFAVQIVDEGWSDLAGRPAYRVRARAVRDDEARTIELRLADVGHRRYVLQMDWDPAHDDFAGSELAGVLRGLRIEGRASAGAALAR